MPTYAYACTACDHRFEVRQSFSDSALSECPECSGSVRKLFNTVGIVFKGSGFYRTDSRTGQKADAGTPGSTDKGGADKGGADKKADASASGSGTSSEKKPAAASASSSGSAA